MPGAPSLQPRACLHPCPPGCSTASPSRTAMTSLVGAELSSPLHPCRHLCCLYGALLRLPSWHTVVAAAGVPVVRSGVPTITHLSSALALPSPRSLSPPVLPF